MTTTEPLPPRHCIARVIELTGSLVTVEEVGVYPSHYRHIIAHARTLEEYGYQPPPPPLDPIRKRAREICAEVYAGIGWHVAAEKHLSGNSDDSLMMQATELALREPGL